MLLTFDIYALDGQVSYIYSITFEDLNSFYTVYICSSASHLLLFFIMFFYW